MDSLEEKLEHRFRDRALLENALTHSSYANENRAWGCESNERLEFLGDSVLGMVVAARLYRAYPDMPEGRMTRLRAQLVCEESLHKAALDISLGSSIRLGRGEEHTGGRTRPSILADAVEAVIAAMYLDGGMDVVVRFIERHILMDLGEPDSGGRDCKTELQELVQRKNGQSLSYELLDESGPDHAKSFTVQVSLNGEAVGAGTGHTKKEAAQTAARAALRKLTK